MVAYQFLPFLRLDGYYVLSDLVGVPDLFSRIRPVLQSLVPGQPSPPALRELRSGARVLVTIWVMLTVPLMLAALGLLIFQAPDPVKAVAEGGLREARNLAAAVRGGDAGLSVLTVLQLAMLALVPIGVGLVILGLLRRARRSRSDSISGARGHRAGDQLVAKARAELRAEYIRGQSTGALPAACRPTIERLDVHVSGALSADAALPVQAHLAFCASCSGRMEDLFRISLRVPRLGPALDATVDHTMGRDWRQVAAQNA